MDEDKTEGKRWKNDTQIMLEYLKQLRASPDLMEDFLIRAGIWDKDGHLAPQYQKTE